MNRRQRKTVIELATVVMLTAAGVILMFNVKDVVIRSEAMRAMNNLSKAIQDYQEEYKLDYHRRTGKDYPSEKVPLPPTSFVDTVKKSLEGRARLGDMRYRALWIDLNAPSDTIVAYSPRLFHSWFVSSGYVLLRLDGTVEWMDKEPFEELLASQQDPDETLMLLP
ncbi:MAG TPA: hypothetical protein ENN81_00375 [Phycisphaerales bacterium]|nr:hypothetical protein [Phycisphaerales bacterium]